LAQLAAFALQLADLGGVEPADVEAVLRVERRRDRGDGRLVDRGAHGHLAAGVVLEGAGRIAPPRIAPLDQGVDARAQPRLAGHADAAPVVEFIAGLGDVVAAGLVVMCRRTGYESPVALVPWTGARQREICHQVFLLPQRAAVACT